jgi:hypothetical protein
LASRVKFPADTELDIKVLDNPTKVADLKQKVFNFLKATNESKSSIDIRDVDYSIVCSTTGITPTPITPVTPAKPIAPRLTIPPPNNTITTNNCSNPEYRASHPAQCYPSALNVTKRVICPPELQAQCPSPSEFIIHVTSTNRSAEPSPSTFRGSPSGQPVLLHPGRYVVNEIQPPPGFQTDRFLSSIQCSGSISAGQLKTCHLVNRPCPEGLGYNPATFACDIQLPFTEEEPTPAPNATSTPSPTPSQPPPRENLTPPEEECPNGLEFNPETGECEEFPGEELSDDGPAQFGPPLEANGGEGGNGDDGGGDEGGGDGDEGGGDGDEGGGDGDEGGGDGEEIPG